MAVTNDLKFSLKCLQWQKKQTKNPTCNHKVVQLCILSYQWVLSPKHFAVLHEKGANEAESRFKVADSHIS